ncbi:MAG: hypothetical protein AAF403_04555, partial [Pseudomonadota bacterium]
MAYNGRNIRSSFNIWPAFVDALASVLMILVFLVMIFVTSQLYLDGALQGRNRTVDTLQGKLKELGQMLGINELDQHRALTKRLQQVLDLNATLKAQNKNIQNRLDQTLNNKNRLESELREQQAKIITLNQQHQSEKAFLNNEIGDLKNKLAIADKVALELAAAQQKIATDKEKIIL